MALAGGILIMASCSVFNGEEEPQGKPVARVYDRYLYQEDLADLIPEQLSGNDSAAFLQNYINAWAKDQLMIYKAEYNLSEEQKNFQDQIEEYRKDLLKFAYRQEYVRQSLDTNIAEAELKEYYEASAENFLLNENILQVSYLVVSNDAPKLKDAISQFFDSDSVSQQQAEEYALQYAYRFDFKRDDWISFEDLQSVLPIETDDQQAFIKAQSKRQWSDSSSTYLLNIYQYRLKGEQAPLDYARDVIRNVLINRRKLELLSKLEQNLLDDALNKQEFEVY